MIHEDLIRSVDKEIEASNNVMKLKDTTALDLNKKTSKIQNEKASKMSKI